MLNVADLEIGRIDGLGQRISCIYGRKAPVYGVYGAGRRVMICFADLCEGDCAQQQRRDMSVLAPLRGEIDGLIDGWRQGTSRSLLGAKHSPSLKGKANRYNRRVADALIVALEGEVDSGRAILAAIKQEILDERIARARFEYLIAAVLTAAVLMFGAWLITSTYALIGDRDAGRRAFHVGIVLLLIASLGAITIFRARWQGHAARDDRERDEDGVAEAAGTVADRSRADLRERFAASFWPSALLFGLVAIPITAMLLPSLFTGVADRRYVADYQAAVTLWRAAAAGSVGAFFSIAIGIRGRTVLPDLLRTANLMDAALRVSIGFIGAGVLEALLMLDVVHLGLGNFDLNGMTLVSVLVAGFVAGFSERLVPDLLAKANAHPGAAPMMVARSSSSTIVVDRDRREAARPLPATPPLHPDMVPEDDAADAHEDGCVSDHEIVETDITDDRDLPPASGGVARVPEEARP